MSTPRTPTVQATRAAYAVLALGIAATIGANVAHAQHHIGARLLALSVPLLLFGCVHLLAHTANLAARLTFAPVALLTFVISRDHIIGLAERYGESATAQQAYPLAIDGAILVATFYLATAHRSPLSAQAAPLSATAERIDAEVSAFAAELSATAEQPQALSGPRAQRSAPAASAQRKALAVAEIAQRLRSGERLTGAVVMADYRIGESTGRAYLAAARALG